MRLYIAHCNRPDGWASDCTTTSLYVLEEWFRELIDSGQGAWFGNAAGIIPTVSVRIIEEDDIAFQTKGK